MSDPMRTSGVGRFSWLGITGCGTLLAIILLGAGLDFAIGVTKDRSLRSFLSTAPSGLTVVFSAVGKTSRLVASEGIEAADEGSNNSNRIYLGTSRWFQLKRLVVDVQDERTVNTLSHTGRY
ncbi:hypothetical protein KCU88_g34, partial [Aureobasidium melanogenum]